MIRVFILFSAGELGGAERTLTRMSLANGDSAISYRLGTIGGDGEWAEWARSQNIDPMVVSCAGVRASTLRDLLRLIRQLRAARPHVIYAAGLRACGIVRLARSFLGRVKIVHAIRTSFPEGSQLAGRYARSERLLKPLTHGYITNSSAGADSLVRIAGIDRKRIRVIPNGIEPTTHILPPLPSRPKAIAVVANLHPLKGHLAFLNVVEAVARAHPDVTFHFIGRDDMGGAVQRAVSERRLNGAVRFEGFQSDVLPFLMRARLFVLPSRITEGFPTSMLEAQAAELPVVAYSVGGIPELIEQDVDGRLVTPANEQAMAQAINSLLDDADRAARMGLAGRRKVESRFSLARCAELHARAWREICTAVDDAS